MTLALQSRVMALPMSMTMMKGNFEIFKSQRSPLTPLSHAFQQDKYQVWGLHVPHCWSDCIEQFTCGCQFMSCHFRLQELAKNLLICKIIEINYDKHY
jgi:hypothetical protein